MSTGISTVQNLLDDAITYDMPYIAHLIYFMLLSNKISLNEDVSKISQVQISDEDYQKFYELYQADTLAVRPVQLFAVQVSKKDYAFYFAKNVMEVQALHQKIFKVTALKIINAHEKMMQRDLYSPDTGQIKSFRDLLTEAIEIPKLVCVLESNQRTGGKKQ